MPRQTQKFLKIPPDQPDCCDQCPLLGLIPKELLAKKAKDTHICLAFFHQDNARMSGRFTHSKKSQHDKKHPLHRLCDDWWDIWNDERRGRKKGKVGIPKEAVALYRLPYIESRQLELFRKI